MSGFGILDYSQKPNSNGKINIMRKRPDSNTNIEDKIKLDTKIPSFGKKENSTSNREMISDNKENSGILDSENVPINSAGFYFLIAIMTFIFLIVITILIFSILKRMGYTDWSFDIMSHFIIEDDEKKARDQMDKFKKEMKNNRKEYVSRGEKKMLSFLNGKKIKQVKSSATNKVESIEEVIESDPVINDDDNNDVGEKNNSVESVEEVIGINLEGIMD